MSITVRCWSVEQYYMSTLCFVLTYNDILFVFCFFSLCSPGLIPYEWLFHIHCHKQVRESSVVCVCDTVKYSTGRQWGDPCVSFSSVLSMSEGADGSLTHSVSHVKLRLSLCVLYSKPCSSITLTFGTHTFLRNRHI